MNIDTLKSYFNKGNTIILEPLSCILRIILLNYKEEGTKISIGNNSIYYNEPSYFQGVVRNINGDGREDLHNLYNPIIKSLEWYPPKKENVIYNYFYHRTLDGIQSLLKSYGKGTIIHHTLHHYYKLIQDSIEQKEIQKIDSDEPPLLNNLKDFWSTEELEIIHKLLLFIDNSKDEIEKKTYISIINTNIITMKENKVREYILKYNMPCN
tara:strand:+ start:4791 stop:5420 length:630 start_codon:yes stop_codon:yes gene_type:complete